jgi:iron complex outermembrane recepter protein
MKPDKLLVGVIIATTIAATTAAQTADEDAYRAYEQCAAILNPPCACDNSCTPRQRVMPDLSVTPIPAEMLAALDPLIVYADRQIDEPGSLSVIEKDRIASSVADRPSEILNQAPGLNIQMNSGQENLIAIRSPVLTGGAGQGSFLILENGIPTRSPAFGNVNSLIEPHLELASAIEIVRGPASARFGSNAVHGLVNVILAEPGDAQSTRVSINTLGRGLFDGAVNLGDTYIALSLHRDTGWRDASGGEQQKVSISARPSIGEWDARIWLSASNLNQETAGFIQGLNAYENEVIARSNPNPEAFRDAWSARLGGRFSHEIANGRVILMPFLRSQAMVFTQHFLPFGGLEKNGHTGVGLLARLEGGDQLRWSIGSDVDIAKGYLKEIQSLPFQQFPGDRRFPQGTHYDFEVDTAVVAVWGEAIVPLAEKLHLHAGLRAETHDFSYTTRIPPGISGRFNVTPDRTDTYDLLTPKLGLVWARENLTYYANYAVGERAPQVSDLYRLQNLQQPGEIETETLDSVELGVRGGAFDRRLVFDLAVYAMQKSNFFFRDSDGLNVIDGKTNHVGAEFSALYEATEAVSFAGNIAWSDQTYDFTRRVVAQQERIVAGNKIDTAPNWLTDLRVDWQATESVLISVSGEHAGEYFADPANTVIYPGHTVFGARVEWAPANNAVFFASARNFANAAYADRADVAFGNQRFFPGEPLNLTIGISNQF